MIYAVLGSILVPEDNGKQNPEESYMKKYQKHVAWSYGFSDDAVYNFINSMVEEIRYAGDMKGKYLNKKTCNG